MPKASQEGNHQPKTVLMPQHSSSAPPAVTFSHSGFLGKITLNRPAERNAMSPALLGAFERAVDDARAAEGWGDIRSLVITGEGSCFSAGADLRGALQRGEPSADPKDGGGGVPGGRLPHERSYGMYAPFLRTLDLEVPVVAALNGHAVGGGFGLALLCDIRIAREDARYGANFARLGLHSGLGIGYLLPRLVGASRAAELLFTGRTITGREAAEMGLVSAAVPADQVLPRATALAEEIARAAPLAVRSMKRSLRRFLGWDVPQAAWEEALAQAETLETDDAREGVAALLDKRPPRFRGR